MDHFGHIRFGHSAHLLYRESTVRGIGCGADFEHRVAHNAQQRFLANSHNGPASRFVENVTAMVTLNKSDLSDHAEKIPVDLLRALSLTTSRRQL